eukprot:11964114-Alexandrium_andersonii.AAC.1
MASRSRLVEPQALSPLATRVDSACPPDRSKAQNMYCTRPQAQSCREKPAQAPSHLATRIDSACP